MNAAVSIDVPRECDAATSALSVPGAVGFYFAIRVCLTFLFFQSDPQLGAEVGVALNLMLLLPVVLYGFGRSEMTIRSALGVGTLRMVLSFLALGVVSLLWSEASSKSVAFGYWIALAMDVVLVLILLRSDGPQYTTDSLLKGFVYGVLCLCVIAWVAPAMKDLRLGDDEFLTPNIIGIDCAIGVLLCQHFAPQGMRWKLVGVALAITLVRSLSKTSIIAFVATEAFYLSRARSISRRAKIGVTLGSLAIAGVFSGLIASYYEVYTNAGNQADTLTGRTSIWLVTLNLAMQKPWFGHGFHSYRSVVPIFGQFQPWHAHNELLQQFFVYGVVGVALVAVLYGSFFRLCRKHWRQPLALTAVSLLLLVGIRGLADTERFDLSLPLWAITAISLSLAKGRQVGA